MQEIEDEKDQNRRRCKRRIIATVNIFELFINLLMINFLYFSIHINVKAQRQKQKKSTLIIPIVISKVLKTILTRRVLTMLMYHHLIVEHQKNVVEMFSYQQKKVATLIHQKLSIILLLLKLFTKMLTKVRTRSSQERRLRITGTLLNQLFTSEIQR